MIGMMASGGISLLPDKTFWAQLVIFFVVVTVLRIFVISPALKVVHRRQEMTDGAAQDVEKLLEKVEQMEFDVEEKLLRARQASSSEAEAKRLQALGNAKKIVEQARTAVGQKIERQRKQLIETSKRTQEDLHRDVASMAALIKGRLTNGNGTSEDL